MSNIMETYKKVVADSKERQIRLEYGMRYYSDNNENNIKHSCAMQSNNLKRREDMMLSGNSRMGTYSLERVCRENDRKR